MRKLSAGKAVTLFEEKRGGRIVGLRLSPASAFAGKDRAVVLRITFDGDKEPAVNVPAGDFFGYSWGEPAARLERLLKGVKATVVERRPTMGGLEVWEVEGLAQKGLRRTLFYFRAGELMEVELQYQRDDWDQKQYDEFMGQVRQAIERKFGAGAVQRLGDVTKPVTDVLPTGLVALDRAIGIGGWPRGRICEVFGPESVGVSTLLLQTLAAAQQRGGVVALIDVDHAFVPEYARRIGCVVEEIYNAQPDDGPMALEIVDALVRSGAFDALALDSVPGLYPSQRYDAESEPVNDALERARLLSEAMRRLAANIDRTRTVVLFGNRQTEKTLEDDAGRPRLALLQFGSPRHAAHRSHNRRFRHHGSQGEGDFGEKQSRTAAAAMRTPAPISRRVRGHAGTNCGCSARLALSTIAGNLRLFRMQPMRQSGAGPALPSIDYHAPVANSAREGGRS
jgi:hypothetical protein